MMETGNNLWNAGRSVMEPKLILPTLVALGVGFFYLSGNQKFELPNVGPLLGATNMADGSAWYASASGESAVLQPSGDPIALGQLAEGINATSISAPPLEIRLLTAMPDCGVTPPDAGQRVAPVLAQPSVLPTQIYSYDDNEFARSAAYEMNRVMNRGGKILADLKKLNLDPMSNSAMDLVTVVVPPGPEPVYLVIKDQFGGIVWNILPMPGATVAQVTLLSGGYSGVVNLPEGARLEIPDIASGACGAFHRVIEKVSVTEARGFVPSDETRAAAVAYEAWFLQTFGIAADVGLTGRDRATAVLAGAAPLDGTPKAAWKAVEGQIVFLMPNDVIYAAEEKQHKEWFLTKANAEITKAFGVPEGSDVLALIKPVTHERTN